MYVISLTWTKKCTPCKKSWLLPNELVWGSILYPHIHVHSELLSACINITPWPSSGFWYNMLLFSKLTSEFKFRWAEQSIYVYLLESNSESTWFYYLNILIPLTSSLCSLLSVKVGQIFKWLLYQRLGVIQIVTKQIFLVFLMKQVQEKHLMVEQATWRFPYTKEV